MLECDLWTRFGRYIYMYIMRSVDLNSYFLMEGFVRNWSGDIMELFSCYNYGSGTS